MRQSAVAGEASSYINDKSVVLMFLGDGLTERPGLHEAVKELNAHREELTPKQLDQ